MEENELQEQTIADLQRITLFLENFLHRPTRWNGTLHIETAVNYSGAKRYDCSICIRRDIAADSVWRWRTLIHEALHAFSPQYSRLEYGAYRGWEEGVVEKIQRLVRQRIFEDDRNCAGRKSV